MKKRLSLCVLGLIWVFQAYSIQNPYVAGGRANGMGGVSVMFSDEWSGLNNQAASAFYERTSFGIAYKSLFSLNTLGIKQAAFNVNTSWGMLGINYQQLDFSEYYESKSGLYYARKFGDYFSMGLQFDVLFIKPSLEQSLNTTFTGEFSLLAKPTQNLDLGFYVFNPFMVNYNTDYGEEKIPVFLRLGMNYAFSTQVSFALEGEGQSLEQPIFKAGVEYVIQKMVSIRAGAATYPMQVSFGAGVLLNGFKVDMSIHQVEVLGRTAAFSISYAF